MAYGCLVWVGGPRAGVVAQPRCLAGYIPGIYLETKSRMGGVARVRWYKVKAVNQTGKVLETTCGVH